MEARLLDENSHDDHLIQVTIIHDQVHRSWSLVKLCSHPVNKPQVIVSVARTRFIAVLYNKALWLGELSDKYIAVVYVNKLQH